MSSVSELDVKSFWVYPNGSKVLLKAGESEGKGESDELEIIKLVS